MMQSDAWYKNRFHSNSGLAMIFSTFEGYTINDSETHGSHLARAIELVLSNPNKIKDIELFRLVRLIRTQTKLNAGQGNKRFNVSAQIVDFHETVEKQVYFHVNS